MSDTQGLTPAMEKYLDTHTGRTRSNKLTYLRKFARYLDVAGLDPEAVVRHDVEQYKVLLKEAGLGVRSIRDSLGTVGLFYRWAVEEEIFEHDPTIYVRLPPAPRRSTRPWLGKDDLKKLLTYADADPDPAIAVLAYLCGLSMLRPQEPRGLDIADISTHDGAMTLRLRERKTGVSDTITIPRDSEAVILRAVDGRTDGPLLISEWTGRRLSKVIAGKRWRRFMAAVPVPYVTPYGLRAGAITLALDAGVPEREVMIAAGHASSAQTAYYDRLRHTVKSKASHQLADYVFDHLDPKESEAYVSRWRALPGRAPARRIRMSTKRTR